MQATVQSQRSDLALAQRDQLLAGRSALVQAIGAEQKAAQGLRDRQDIAREIEKMRMELAARQSGSRLAALADLRAPRPGVVLSVAKGGPGSLMAEGKVVVVLVPTDVPLIAEIGIRSAETGNIAMADPVTIKIDAFPWRRHGASEGKLQDVSHGSFTPEGTATALHSGRVTLTGVLANLPAGTGLLPGMTLTAEIKTGTRTVLDYFLDPLMRGLNESLREP